MNTLPKLALNIIFIFSAIITQPAFANKSHDKEPSCTTKSELDKAFISAVKSNNLKEMEKLINAGADVNVSISYVVSAYDDYDHEFECSPLIFAIKENRPEMVKILLQVKNKLHITLNQAIDEAIRHGCSAIVEELIKEGADLNFINNENKDTLLIAAIKKGKRKVIEIFLKSGVNINHANKYGKTALMQAIEQYDLSTVQDLLKLPEITKGSFFGFGKKPINQADNDGNTALIIAIKNIRTSFVSGDKHGFNMCKNSWNILEALLKVPGIDRYHANNKGETAETLLKKLKEKEKNCISNPNTIYV